MTEEQEQAEAPLAENVLVLTEDALSDGDAQRIVQLHAGEQLEYRVLVPADTEHSVLAEVIDHLSMLELKEAAKSLRPRRAREAKMDAGQQLAASVEALERAGVTASGEVTQDDPIPALRDAVRRHGAREVVVVTTPHAVEDTLHRDWASRARDEVGVPVLHVYAGTTFLG
ncbi:MAG TPA: hypothetical protein VFX41_12955 [Actinomycetales bacterium]|nr:hypothetical protein [Actinomycetales bacterium]